MAIISGGIDAGDIHQGGLGDCYLLAAMQVLADRPELIKE